MSPENLRYGGGTAGSLIHPLVLAALVAAVVLIFVLPRRFVLIPFLFTILLVPYGQNVVVGGAHVFVARILIVAGLIRSRMGTVRVLRPYLASGWTSIDKAFLAWAIFHSVAFTLLYRDGSAVVNQIGFLWDALGSYFILRSLIREESGLIRVVRILGSVVSVVAVFMLVEKLTGDNWFGYLGTFGRVSEIRSGSIRARGPFMHPLLAGTFGGTLFPLFWWLWKERASRALAAAGMISAVVVVWASACSTPLLALVSGICALFAFPFRRRMRVIRWGVSTAIGAASLAMNAPVWFLMARVDLTGASSGYHRAMLVDQFFRHFSDWWLLGVKDASSWGFDMWDACNQFVSEGETGGLFALLAFVAIIWRAFSGIGTARKRVEGDSRREWLLWSVGGLLFCQTVAFFGISYFDQVKFTWYLFVAITVAATGSVRAAAIDCGGSDRLEPCASPAGAEPTGGQLALAKG